MLNEGKTIQTIALLAWLASERCDWGPHLVVVPTSVMLNWELEFRRWCPAVRYVMLLVRWLVLLGLVFLVSRFTLFLLSLNDDDCLLVSSNWSRTMAAQRKGVDCDLAGNEALRPEIGLLSTPRVCLCRFERSKPNAFHVCITSYKLVTQDVNVFRRKRWSYFILDEAQNIKNYKSQRWQVWAIVIRLFLLPLMVRFSCMFRHC